MEKFIQKLNEKSIFISLQSDENLKISFNGDKLDNDILRELKAKKAELISYLKHHSSKDNYQPIPVIGAAESYKLSSAQLRLWILSQTTEGAIAYSIPGQLRLKQAIDVPLFVKALEAVIDRHEVLRTVFREDASEEVRQWVLLREALDFKIDYKDFRQKSDGEALVASYISEDSAKAFDLVNGPLFRAALLQLEDQEYIFYYNVHHIISDGWSMSILSKDVFEFYHAFKNNIRAQLRPLPIQYRDYAVWQLSELKNDAFASHKSYWLNGLSGELPKLNLPSSKQRPSLRTFNGRHLSAYIDPETTQLLKAYTKANNGSLFMGLLAVWNVLMYRYTSQKDIITGTIVAGREHADLDDQIGCYVNALALRNTIDPEERFSTFYERVKLKTFDAYNHQMYPFDQLVKDLGLKRNLSRNFVFDVLFTFENVGGNIQELSSKESKVNDVLDHGKYASKFDLEVRFLEKGGSLEFNVTYNTDVYDFYMVEALMLHYQQMLFSVLDKPSQKLSEIDYFSEQEKSQLVGRLNNTRQDFLTGETLIDVFSAQVTAHPDRIAVHYDGVSLSYAELDARSNQLANYLQAQEIKANNLVALLLDRSSNMIVGIMAVLKSGAGYVPIDPSLPKQRISYMLTQSGASLLLSEPSHVTRYAANLPVVSITDDAIWASSPAKVEVDLAMDDLAYCIFTSGSSGRPKGVVMSHSSVLNLVKGLEYTVYNNYDEGLRVSLLASYAFDASVQQIFGSLLLGHSLYMIDDESRKDGQALLNFYNSHEIAISDGTPTHLRLLLKDLVGGEKLPHLKAWVLAGEYLDKDWVSQFYDRFSNKIDMYNFYGPTETCVDSTSFKIDPSALVEYATIPIGKPLPNERVYITDQLGSLVAPGVVGELCIAGAGLGKCYVGDEKLTAERFVRGWIDGEDRVYRTGDLARWLPDGNLEYCGRMDEQVKLRGYRIELAEIEHQMNNHPEIRQSVVLLKEREGEAVLVGYYESSQELISKDLREYLSKDLPTYMLPSYYVYMDQFPVNTSGKIAKKDLPDFDLAVTNEYEAPSNEVEEILVKIIAQTLKRDEKEIGVYDNFFDLGVTSLSLIAILNKINKKFNVKLGPVSMHQWPNVSEYTKYLTNQDSLEGTEKEHNEDEDLSEVLEDVIDIMTE